MTTVPELAPFRGIRYASGINPALVTSPPYDVVSPAQQKVLLDRHPRNFVRLILPTGGEDRYRQAAKALGEWRAEGTLVADAGPSYYLYMMDYDFGGERQSTAGIMGALWMERFGDGAGVFPHEDTMPGPKADRLELMRATGANLEPLWFVAAESFPAFRNIVEHQRPITPLAELTDPSDVRHRIWGVSPSTAAEVVARLRQVPVVIADGHHRYETAITYRDEMRAPQGAGPWDSVLAMVVDPAHFGPTLRPIHRVVRGIKTDALVSALRAEVFDADIRALAEAVSKAGAGTLGIASREGRWTIHTDGAGLDSEFLRRVLADHLAEISYEHDLELLIQAVETGAIAFLMAPVELSLVIERALSGQRMPPKTTLFWPKPLSGLVFRSLSRD